LQGIIITTKRWAMIRNWPEMNTRPCPGLKPNYSALNVAGAYNAKGLDFAEPEWGTGGGGGGTYL